MVEYKHKIGFKGPILIEPKPREPTKHQYDYDVATVAATIDALGLEGEVKINIEQNHALLAGHTFEHEIALAAALVSSARSTSTGGTINPAETPISLR